MSDKIRSANFSRRTLLAGIAATQALTAVPAAAQTAPNAREQAQAALKDAKGTKLVLLGTGAGPVPGRSRRMTSHVMVSNGAAYVLDCGLGVVDRYAETGIPFGALRGIFITHHHFDHNVEYGPLLSIGWVQGMPLSVRAYGPPPLKQMTADYLKSMQTTIGFWSEDLKMKPLESVDVTEVPGAGPVMQDDNVRVTSTVVQHPPVKPALAYRFDFHDRSIVFSGDTVAVDAVAELAKGADVLVHEAMYLPALVDYLHAQIAKGRPVKFEDYMAHMNADHTPVEDVGRIAAKAGVKTLVLSHLTPAIDSISDDTWRAPAAKFFKGDIVVGRDLMVL
ncbi:MAG TPA: MBL fold metallo-hydrolase [Xanthobacteraceae bacterium]|jgi:ribonuclease BN (tRNA processing enzyme)|nr:MBL fold metallo-hydrolase [Xanthobacteraceae bacterium]